MAIDPILYPDSDDLVHPDKSFYPLEIPVSHWQLRHYISHPDPDVLYYASRNEVFYLNTATRKRKHIAKLPFDARCLASGFGYVCVGGEQNGHFAVIKLEDTRTADVDAAISLDYWQTTAKSAPRAVHTKVERIGEEIVNSVSVHQIQDIAAHLHDIVAVLTNNDKTVRIYSLLHNIEASVLRLPDPMNHATISPDGRSLVAVGDLNTVYFYRRFARKDPPQVPKPHNRLNMTSAGWELIDSISLYIPYPDTQKGYFTTAWSSNCRLLAVGSEAGYISVFDTSELQDDNTSGRIDVTCIVTVPSSRPDLSASACPGAVRSMIFAPDPWDLLVWAEDQGRICVADLRRGLKSKQVVNLDPSDISLTRLHVEDLVADEDPGDARRLLELEEEFIHRRLREHDAHTDTRITEGLLRQQNQRQSRLASRYDEPWYPDPPRIEGAGLTNDEQSILESLRTTRQREEELAQGAAPRSINYTSASLFNSATRRRELGESNNARPSNDATRTDLFPELSRSASRSNNPVPDHDYHMQLLHLEAQNRRRLLIERQQNDGIAEAPGTTTTATTTATSRPIPPHARRASDLRRDNNDEEGPWRVISDAFYLAGPALYQEAGLPSSSADRDATEENERLDHRRALIQQRERLRNLQRSLDASTSGSTARDNNTAENANTELQSRYRLIRAEGAGTGGAGSGADLGRDPSGFEAGWELLRQRSTRRTTGILGQQHHQQPREQGVGVRTAGLAISRDGRTVWAATEEGVFEIGLRFKERAMWPAVQML